MTPSTGIQESSMFKTLPARCAISARILSCCLALVLGMLTAPVQADSYTKRAESPAQYPRIQYDGAAPAQKSFNFSGAKATLNKQGEWMIEGTLKHNGLLCGDYEVGMRFGIGKEEGCIDNEWISGDQFVAQYTLCNNAIMPYKAMMQEAVLAESFDRISCAERIVRCVGICK